MLDPTCHIHLSSVSFPKKAWIMLCKTHPDLVWMAWSGLGQTHLVWKQAGGQESLAQLRAESTDLLPVSHFQTHFCSFTDVPDNIVQNQPGSDFLLANSIRFWPNESSLEASWCARIIWPASGQCFPADPDWM